MTDTTYNPQTDSDYEHNIKEALNRINSYDISNIRCLAMCIVTKDGDISYSGLGSATELLGMLSQMTDITIKRLEGAPNGKK